MTTSTANRYLGAATLAVWSGVLLHAFFSGRVKHLLHPNFHIPVLAAGIVLALLVIATLIAPSDEACCDDDTCSHATTRSLAGRIAAFAVLLLPIKLASVLSPDGFSMGTMLNRGVMTDVAGLKTARPPAPAQAYEPPLPRQDGLPPDPEAIELGDFIPRSPEGRAMVEVLDLLYAAQDPTIRKELDGKSVEVVGQILPALTNNAAGNRFKLVRMFMTCCAADARPIAILVETDRPPDQPDMAWVRIVGTATYPTEGGRMICVVRMESAEPADPPEESMLY